MVGRGGRGKRGGRSFVYRSESVGEGVASRREGRLALVKRRDDAFHLGADRAPFPPFVIFFYAFLQLPLEY